MSEANIPNMRDSRYLEDSRDKKIVRTSGISILTNILLAAFKAVVGLAANSISITLDAVNNLSDALSGIITIIGTKLSTKPADHDHPHGYGRIEYLSATVIAAIVLYAGITAMIESVTKIIHPETANYSYVSLFVIAAAVAVKLVLGGYVKSVGKTVGSKSLVASGTDARNDAILSASVFITAVLMKFTGISLEAYVGVVISVIILKSGFEMLKDTLDDILGTRIDAELSKKIKQIVSDREGVRGAYDLVLHSYGPDRLEGSVHIEVPDTMTAEEIDRLSVSITRDVYRETNVAVAAIGIYSQNTKNQKAVETELEIRKFLQGYRNVTQMHGFYLDEENKVIKFDIIIRFEAEDREGEYKEIHEKVHAMYPGYHVRINLDADISD